MVKIQKKRVFSFPTTFLITIIAALGTLFLPFFTFSFDISLVLTVISLLFAILIGFFFASATSNFLRFQTLITDEDATLMTIYRYAVMIDPKGAERVADAIDTYMICSLDYEFLAYAPHVHAELDEIVKAVDQIECRGPKDLSLLQNLQSAKMHLYSLNQEVTITSKRIVSPSHWIVIVLLAGLMGVLLLSLRDGSLLSAFFISVLLVTIFLTLKLLSDVDSNRLLAKQLSYQSPQMVFKAIERLPYYPETALSFITIPFSMKKYRVGVYKNIKKSFEKTIRTLTQ